MDSVKESDRRTQSCSDDSMIGMSRRSRFRREFGRTIRPNHSFLHRDSLEEHDGADGRTSASTTALPEEGDDQSHRRTLSSLLASMKGSSLAAPAGAIKRAGSATNLTSLSTTTQDQQPRNITSASSSMTASMGRSLASKVPFVSFEGSIMRTSSVNNIASSCLPERPSVTARVDDRSAKILASLSRSGAMLFMDETNLSQPEWPSATTLSSSKTSLSPSQFFRRKRSSSSNRCLADSPDTGRGDPCQSTPSAGHRRADRPLSSPFSVSPHLSTSQSNSDSLANSCTQRFLQQVSPHLTSTISGSLPPSSQHSSPPSPQHSPPRSPQCSPPRTLQCSPPRSPQHSLPPSPQHSPHSSPQHSPPLSPRHSPPPPRKVGRSPSPATSNPFAVFTSDSEVCVQQTLQQLQQCPHQDESLLLLARQSAPALLASLPPLHRKPRIAATLERVQSLVDAEGARRLQLARAEGEACDGSSRARVLRDIELCDTRTQALALLSMFLFTALHLCQDQIEEQRQAVEQQDGEATQD